MGPDGWVGTWASAPQLTEPDNLPPPPFRRPGLMLPDTTLRQTVPVSIGGGQLRLRLSNTFGGAPLTVTAASVALPRGGRAGVSAVRPGTPTPVRFGGAPAVTVPAGEQAVSDPLRFPLEPRSNLTVTLHLADGQASDDVTSHPGSRTTSYLVGGDHVLDADLPTAVPVEHWYLISGVDVPATDGAAAVVVLGDSLTDGRGSTTDGNDRWPDRLLARLQAFPGTRRVAVLNQGTGGNRVLNDGLGPSALSRVERDVLAQHGVRWLVLFEGINDLGTADATPDAQRKVTAELIAAYSEIVARARARGIAVYGATLTPFGGNPGYDDPAGLREASRQELNRWIRTGGGFDEVVDLDRAVRDPSDPRRLLPSVDTGDHLHLLPGGYQLLADAVPLDLFRRLPGV